jgi:putative iron-only hydrogenase system regulator
LDKIKKNPYLCYPNNNNSAKRSVHLFKEHFTNQSDPKEIPMEKRIGSALILVGKNSEISLLNEILSRHAQIIISRQGIPLREKKINLISLVLEGSTDEIGALTGQIGRLKSIRVKSMLIPLKENKNDED